MSDGVIERLRKHYTGRQRKEVTNPCITAREAIEIANHISDLEQPCSCQPVADLRKESAKLQSELAALKAENANLKTVMIAAAEEISAHWEAHCDAEGYGPANLLHRLEEGIPSEYGYTAGAFKKLQSELAAAREGLERARHGFNMIASGELDYPEQYARKVQREMEDIAHKGEEG